jgi:hypothetical protein
MRMGDIKKALSKAVSKPNKVKDRTPGFQGWNTTDDDERERRR